MRTTQTTAITDERDPALVGLRRRCLQAIELAECGLLLVDRATLAAQRLVEEVSRLNGPDEDYDFELEEEIGLDLLKDLLETQAAWVNVRLFGGSYLNVEKGDRDARAMLAGDFS